MDNGAETSDLSDSAESDSDDCPSDCDDELVCNACGHAFPSVKKLTDHQVAKRHFGCLRCGEVQRMPVLRLPTQIGQLAAVLKVFNSVSKLEEHKNSAGHGSSENLAS